jgi:lipoprotein-anchoring transpeptidase ErfK/SrfK
VALCLGGCASSMSNAGARPPTSGTRPRDGLAARAVPIHVLPAHETIVAIAKVPLVPVFPRPRHAPPEQRLANPQPSGAPLVFVVRRSMTGWLDVLLPVRPNGSSGWIRRSDVTLRRHDFRIVVNLHEHVITVYRGEAVFDREAIGVGKAQTPTPGGVYYTKALLQPPNPNGMYGPYAYELSGFSDVLTSFNGGNGVIGIHGTNEPWLLGHDVSHGCIRMSNAGITRLAHALPLGVPVAIRA